LLKTYLERYHGIKPFESEHMGVFVQERLKIASIGMQVRHGLTSHGFAINVSEEPLAWFDQVVACGLADVRAASVQSVQRGQSVQPGQSVQQQQQQGGLEGIDMMREKKRIVRLFGEMYGREIRELGERDGGEIWNAVKEMEHVADEAGDWHKRPIS
jgi:lipoyl(octanoyl) transferase 2